jgi:4-carboxymuconolactone decarboxylase
MGDKPRVDPVDTDEVDAEIAGLLALTANTEGDPLRVIATLAHRADLVAPFLTWSAALAGTGALTPRAHELVALRTAWQHQSDYEWGHHLEYARRDGVTDEDLARLRFAALDDWNDEDRALLAVTDAMCAGAVDSTTWDEAARLHEADALVELVWTVGQYASLSMITDALGVEPEPGLEPCPARDDGSVAAD